jgi:hypothetical protein
VPAFGALAAALVCFYLYGALNGPAINADLSDNLIAKASYRNSLPTTLELDEMATMHAVHSFAVAAGDAGEQQETLADAISRSKTP